MQVNSNYQHNGNTFTGFKFNPASKERFLNILENINDPSISNKCRRIISSQKDNSVEIKIDTFDYIFGHEADGLEAYINGKFSHDSTGINSFGFVLAPRATIDEGYSIVRFLKKAADGAEKVLNDLMEKRIASKESDTFMENKQVIDQINEYI